MKEPTGYEPLTAERTANVATEVTNWVCRQAREQLGPDNRDRPWVLLFGNVPFSGRLHATQLGAESELYGWIKDRIAKLDPAIAALTPEQLKELVAKKSNPVVVELLRQLFATSNTPHHTRFYVARI